MGLTHFVMAKMAKVPENIFLDLHQVPLTSVCERCLNMSVQYF